MVVVLTALLLPPSHVLRHDQIGDDGRPWPSSRMGETGEEGDGGSAAVIAFNIGTQIGPIGHIGPILADLGPNRYPISQNPSALIHS